MPTNSYEQYYFRLTDSDLELLSASVEQTDSEFLENISYLADSSGIYDEQTCILYYSEVVKKYVWMRAVTLQSTETKEVLLHVLHTSLKKQSSVDSVSSANDSPENAACLSLLSSLNRNPRHFGDTGRLVFSGELPGLRISADNDVISAIVSLILFGFYRGDGITVVCGGDEYAFCYAQLAVYLMGFLPPSLKKLVSVRMNLRGESFHSLFNIVRDHHQIPQSDNLTLHYHEGVLDCVSMPVLSPVRKALCDYLAELYVSDVPSYHAVMVEILGLLGEAQKDGLPTDALSYFFWASQPEKIRLSMPVSNATEHFLSLSSLGKWNHIKPKAFFHTLYRLNVLFLEGMLNCSDASPSGEKDNFEGLLSILINGHFPDEMPFGVYSARLIRHLIDSKREKEAIAFFLELQHISPDDAAYVSHYFGKNGSGLGKYLKLVPSLRDLAEANVSASPHSFAAMFFGDDFKPKVTGMLCNAVIHPLETGNLEETEFLLPTAAKNVGDNRPEWLTEAADLLTAKLTSVFLEVPDWNLFGELLAYRCRMLHQVFGIDSSVILSTVMELYRNTDNRQHLTAAVTHALTGIGIDPQLFEPWLEYSDRDFLLVIAEKISVFSSLSQMLARAHELIARRKPFFSDAKKESSAYCNSIKIAFSLVEKENETDPPDYFIRLNYTELLSLIDGSFQYIPLYEDSVPFCQSNQALLALSKNLSLHLDRIHRQFDLNPEYLEENALTTVLMIKTNYAIFSDSPTKEPAAHYRVNYQNAPYAHSLFKVILNTKEVTPRLCAAMLTEEIFRPVSEIIQYVPFPEADKSKPMKFRMILLMAMHILFGESTWNIRHIMVENGYSFSMYSVTLAALIANQTPDARIRHELDGNVNNAFRLYNEAFLEVSNDALVKTMISKIVSGLAEKGILPGPEGALISSDIDSGLKNPINAELLALQNKKTDSAERSRQIRLLCLSLEQYRRKLEAATSGKSPL